MQGGRVVRVFISSPGDVGRERLRASMVVRRLDREFRRFFNVEAYFWEHEVQLATKHFQDNIKPPSEFDIVVLILWSRLGTRLPGRTGTREYRGIDGRRPVTGTEWEYEEARAAYERTGAPAVLVFRNRSVTNVSTDDLTLRARQLQQLEALDGFWRRHFEDRGIFKTASNSYRGLDEFEERLEAQLRQLLEELIQKRSPDPAARDISWYECPFRGLEAYDFVHAPIFFGRDAAVRQALEQLVANATDGAAFLLVLGASGSGKSSLIRAGLLPELWVPRAVRGVGAWRRVVFHPGESPRDLFLGLASRIVQANPQEPGVGLPELLSQGYSAADLASHLRANASSPGAPFQTTLDDLALTLAQRGAVLHGEQVRLVLVIDQLEELFTDTAVAPDERVRFTELLAGLAHSGSVWVVATMRSDFWHRAAEAPILAELVSGSGRLDLWPPNRAELTEIIRRPAAAAGLRFGEDAERVSLDAWLADDAANDPGTLPLLSYTLEALFIRDIDKARGDTLRWETYEEIGHLQGAIARRAEEMVAELGRDGVDDGVIARVLRRLVSLDDSEGNRIVARAVPLDTFPMSSPERHLVDAFLRHDMRLLIAEGDAAEARIRVAHEALLSEWDRARRLIAEDTLNLSRRRRLEESEQRWRAATLEDRPGLLLRPGLELNEAEALVTAWIDELDPALLYFVEESRQAEQRRIEERDENARRLAERLAEAQVNESRFLTSIAEAELRDGNIERALLIARGALPFDMRKPDRPIWDGAFVPLVTASSRDRALAAMVGHTSRLTSTAFSSNGTRVVTASKDGTARLWDAETGSPLATLGGHKATIMKAVFSPDGTRLVTVCADGTAGLWHAESGTLFATLDGHTSEIDSASFSPDGTRVLTASCDCSARVWDAQSGAALIMLSGHADWVTCGAFSSDGALITTASHDRTARVWDAKTGTALAVFSGHTDHVTSVVFSPDGSRILTASGDGTARLWDVKSGGQLATFGGKRAWLTPDGALVVATCDDNTTRLWNAESGAVLTNLDGFRGGSKGILAFSQDNTRFVTDFHDDTARLWDAKSGAFLAILDGHTSSVTAAAFSADGTRVVTASFDDTARVWDTRSGSQTGILSGHTHQVTKAAFSPDGMRVLTVSADHTARLWNAERGVVTAVLAARDSGHIWSASFSPDGKRIVTASQDGEARVWDAESGAVLVSLDVAGSFIEEDEIIESTFNSDGSRILTASGGAVRVWDADSGTELSTFRGEAARFSPDGTLIITSGTDDTGLPLDIETGAVLAKLDGYTGGIVVFSPNGRRFVSSFDLCTLRVWDPDSGGIVATLKGHEGGINSAAFSPDGTRVITASGDRSARMWDAESGIQLAILSGHANGVTSAEFSPDGTLIVTASADQTARLWDAGTGALLAILYGHNGCVWSAAFSLDGARIVTASDDCTARLWPVWPLSRDATATYIAIASMRNLTPEECVRAFLFPVIAETKRGTPEPDRHVKLAEAFERAIDCADGDLERALFHYVLAARLFAEQGRDKEARAAQLRRGSLARVLPPQTAVRIAYEAMDWTPTVPG
jgi:WD40 repeat protein